jgi:hypothetical protein
MGSPDLKAQLQSAVDDVFASADAAERAIATVKRRRRVGAAALATAGVAGVLAGVLLVSGGSNAGDAPATLIPTVSSPSIPPSSCGAPVACQGAPLTPVPSAHATTTAVPNVDFKTGISDAGPQISATRWMNVNSWSTHSADGTSLSVYAGGATIDHTLQQSDDTLAAVLVITPADYYRFEHGQVALADLGTIYRPSPDPQGKLRAVSANGNLLTLNLVGTSQNYVFNAATDTFRK